MRFVALVSGGKDSIFSILEAQKEGHELVACVHLGRPVEEDEESYMYQTAGSEVVKTLVEECIQVPLIHHVRKGKSVQTSLVYEQSNPEDAAPDEVEDLYVALREAVDRFPSVQAVASGALLSTYQRVRIENVCQRLGLTSLSYLWRRGSQHDTLRAMIQAGLEVVLVRTAAPPGLMPRKHLNRSLMALESVLYTLYDRYRMHVCGEGGEYESLCLFAPGLYRKRLVLDEVEIQLDENDDGVGNLLIKSCHAQELEGQEAEQAPAPRTQQDDRPSTNATNISAVAKTDAWTPPPQNWLPRVCRCEGGLWHTSGIVSPKIYSTCGGASEADLAVSEARDVLFLLKALLAANQCTAHDVGMVHLYLSDISHFQRINQYYRDCFGVLLPPSRSCVALGNLPMNRRVMLDCWVLSGSGEYMRRQGVEQNKNPVISPYSEAALMNTSVRYRQVLHVQSLSHWAPVCVGPYSQTNTLLGALHFLAGSIGLRPASMNLRDTWDSQLEQSWKNLAQILDALDQSSLTEHMLSGMVYISDHVYATAAEESLSRISSVSQHAMNSNAGVVAGLVDDIINAEDLHGGYEDEETRIEIEGPSRGDTTHTLCPLLVVAIPAMPVGAQVEVEIVTAACNAADCLPVADYRGFLAISDVHAKPVPVRQISWDAGYDFNGWPEKSPFTDVEIYWSLRTLGAAGGAFATVVAALSEDTPPRGLNAEAVTSRMMKGLAGALHKTNGSVSFEQLLGCRIYYVSIQDRGSEPIVFDVASRLEAAFNATLPNHCRPAVTVVPVHGIGYLDFDGVSTGSKERSVVLALQATFVDPVSLQTELWIRQGRPAE